MVTCGVRPPVQGLNSRDLGSPPIRPWTLANGASHASAAPGRARCGPPYGRPMPARPLRTGDLRHG
eukprot:5904764-Heterocapsa_arctica.AAC.1